MLAGMLSPISLPSNSHFPSLLNHLGQKFNGLNRLARFATVGLTATTLDLSLFTALHGGLGLAAPGANLVSYSCGILCSYQLHRRWTYADRSSRAGQAARFITVSLIALTLNTCLVLGLSSLLTALVPGAPSAAAGLLSKLMATCAGLIWSLLANHFWTFQAASEPLLAQANGSTQA